MTRRASVGALLALGLIVLPARAIDTPNERVTLEGLTAVHVVFDEVGEEGARLGLTRSALQPEVEQRLKRAGLRPLTPTEALASKGRPTLTIRLSLLRIPGDADLYVYSVDLSLRQKVQLMRARTIESYAVTWSDHRAVGVARVDQPEVVRGVLFRKVDQFVTAWRVSNRERY